MVGKDINIIIDEKYHISNDDRMFAYVWSEDENECKFGQRYVNKGENPFTECSKRIRESMGVRKDKFDDGGITINGIFDITEYSKKYNQFSKKSKVDDHIRKSIGFVKQGEVHSIPADDFIKYFVKFMSNSKTVFRPTYKPRFYQDVINMMFLEKLSNCGEQKYIDFALELAPRFGKTIWSIDLIQTLFNDYGYKICVLPTYVLTALGSFSKEFYQFNGYSDNMVLVGKDDDLASVISEFYGKKMIIVELSLHIKKDGEIELDSNKVNILSKLPTHEKVNFMDEADFGTHRGNSQGIIRRIDSKLNVYMTGTAIEKVINPLENLGDNIIRWSYTDMLMVKKGEHPLQKHLATV